MKYLKEENWNTINYIYMTEESDNGGDVVQHNLPRRSEGI